MKKNIFLLLFFFVTLICFADHDFDIIFEELMKHEGKIVVKAEDGVSKFGVTKYYHPNPASLTEKQAKKIIYEKVYKQYNIDQLNSLRLKHICLDFIYHTNPYKAISMIKKTINSTNKENTLDEETVTLLNKTSNIENKILNKRQCYIRSLKLYFKYKKGWEKRISYFREENYLQENKIKYVFSPMFEESTLLITTNNTIISNLLSFTHCVQHIKHFLTLKEEQDYFFYVRKSNFP